MDAVLRHNPWFTKWGKPLGGRGSPRRLLEKTRAMVSAQIEKIKQEYTDQYVVTDANRPELARFRDHVGQVKTVNMSGRALVEFIDYHLNIGWFDIDLDYLKVVDKPAPKEKAASGKKPVAKKRAAASKKPASAAGEKKLSPLEMARRQGAAGDGGGVAAPKAKRSTADILAAARGGAASTAKDEPTAETPKPAAAKVETEAEAPTETSASNGTKVDRSSMSVVNMIAHCREKDAN